MKNIPLLDFHAQRNPGIKHLFRFARTSAVCFCFGTFAVMSENICAQNAKVNINRKETPVEVILSEIEKQTDYLFVYNKDINVDRLCTVNMQGKTVAEILTQMFGPVGVTWKMEGNNIVLTTKDARQQKGNKQQKQTISGKVIDNTGLPIIGASILEEGTNNGIITDIDGNFKLTLSSPDATISISYIGYITQKLKAEPGKPLNITLKEDNQLLDEVVVVGFGTQKKVNLTGSVSVVTAEEIQQRPVTNLTQALQGTVPGLRITQTDGSLEDSPSINVRGTTTIGQGSSGSPLVLIDGVEGDLNSINPQDVASISVLKDAAASSIYGSRAPFGVILITTKSGNDEGKITVNYNNSFRFGTAINMNHSMNSVDFASWINDTNTNGGAGVYFTPERMDQIVAYHNAKPYGPGSRITANGEILYSISDRGDGSGLWQDGYAYGINDEDYFDLVFKDWTFSQEHNFSINGGNKKLNYYASANYMHQNGMIKIGEDGLTRYNVMLKVNSQVTDWLHFTYSTRFNRQDYKRPAEMTSMLYHNIVRQGWPVLPSYDRNGYLYYSPSPLLGLAEGGEDRWQNDRVSHQVNFTIEPIKNWVTHIDFNYSTYINDRHWDTKELYNHDVNGNPVVVDDTSEVHEGYYKDSYYNFSAYTEYTHLFNDVHNFHIMAGFQAENQKQRQYGLTRVGLLFNDKSQIDMTTGLGPDGSEVTPDVYGSENEWATAGFFGRVNYTFNDKYLLEGNIRADGTSRFRSDNRWKVFPSVSVGWNLAREAFFEPLANKVDMLKLRVSFGTLGNQNTTNWYQTYQTMSVGASNGSWLMNGRQPNTAYAPGLVSEDLTWETIQTTNIGLDWSLLNNRLTGSFEYYIRDTKDMVGYAPELPNILGTSVPVTNNTDLRTKGWELTLGWRDQLNNGLSYGVAFNLSDARTKITRYPNNPSNDIWSYIPGREIGEIWGYTTVGLARTDEEMQQHLATLPNGRQDALGSDWRAGDIMYADLNGDGYISSGSERLGDTGDLSVIGNTTPRFLFGLDLNASWKGFDLRAFFQGVMKRDIWNGGVFTFGATGGGMWQATGIEAVSDYFRNENTWSVQEGYMDANTDAYLPRPLYSNKNLQTQTRYLQNAAYIRLKNLQIGYTIPATITQRWGISNLRIFFSGENLWTASGVDKQYDPETLTGGYEGEGIGYPLQKTLSFGLNITL